MRRANPRRGERLIWLAPGEARVARPTFDALATIEGEFGDLLDVAAILGDPLRVTLEVLGGAVEAWLAAGAADSPTRARIIECAVHGRMQSMLADAQALLGAYFDTGAPREVPPAEEAERTRSLPWRDYVGTAVALWGLAPEAAWGMTVPEWWAAADAHARVHGGRSDGPTPQLSLAKARELAALNRADVREAMQRRWKGGR